MGRSILVPQVPSPGPAGATATVWTVEETAAFLRVSVDSIYRLVQRNEIPYTRIGRLIRFSPSRMQAFIES